MRADFIEPVQSYPSDEARYRFRRLWSETEHNSERVLLLRLMDRRGYVAHPFDFLPKQNWDGLPDAYAPLLAWQRTIKAGADGFDPHAVYSSERAKSSYGRLRADDPAKAQDWLVTELKRAKAQKRLRLLRDLAYLFDQSDVNFLSELNVSDRSPKVRELVSRLLRRLGANAVLPADLSALDSIKSAKRGFLRRRLTFWAPEKMSGLLDLHELIWTMGFPALATHLSVSETELIDAWDWVGSHATISYCLRGAILETGSENACAYLLDRFPDALIFPRYFSSGDDAQWLSSPLRDKAIQATIEANCEEPETFWRVPEGFGYWRMEGLSKVQSEWLLEKLTRLPNMVSPRYEVRSKLSSHALFRMVFSLAMCLQPREAQLALDHIAAQRGLQTNRPDPCPASFQYRAPTCSFRHQYEKVLT